MRRIVPWLATLYPALAVAQDAPLRSWTVASTPTSVVADDGRPETEFNRIIGAWRIANGRIAIANAGSAEIRIFSADGRFERAFGRQGSGPGEFQRMGSVWRGGDSLFVFDPRLKRVTTIDAGTSPRLLGTLQITATGEREDYDLYGRTLGGQWLARAQSMVGWTSPPGVQRKQDGIGIIAATGSGTVRWIGEPLGMAGFVHNPTGKLENAALGPIAFSPWSYAVASGANIWFGESGAPEITRFDVATGMAQRVALPISARAPSPAIIAAAHAEEERNEPGGAFFREARYSARYLPRQLPFFSSLVAVADGSVWVEEYSVPSDRINRYLVIDRTGTPSARVSVPLGFRLTEAGYDYIVGIHRDADDVESVRLYRLTRTP